MYIEHIAMYVNDLEKTKEFFIKYFGASSNGIYHNKKTKRGGRTNIPSIVIFDMEKNIFTEMEVKISDYVLLKMYFEKHKIMVKDEFKKI